MSHSRKRKISVVCRYLTYTDADGQTWRLPMVHLRVAYGGMSLRTLALVDSGATGTFLPPDIAESLNMPIGESTEVTGAGGKLEAYASNADLTVLKGLHPVIEFKNFPVLIPRSLEAIPYVILGRDSLFQKAQITFRERDEKLLLKSY